MKWIFLAAILFCSMSYGQSMCQNLFASGQYSPDGKKVAELSENGHRLKIANTDTGMEYSFESNEYLFGEFSPDSHFWVMKSSTSVEIWDFSGRESRLIKMSLKNPIKILFLKFESDKLTRRKFLRIWYLRKKIDPVSGRYFLTKEELLQRIS